MTMKKAPITPRTSVIESSDGTNRLQIESNGGAAVNIQDQHTPAFDSPFAQLNGTPTTLAADAVMNAWSVSITSGHGLTTGDQFLLNSPLPYPRSMLATVLGTPDATTVELDTPVNYAYPAATSAILPIATDLAVDGSITRQTFRFGTTTNVEIDVVRIMFQMITTAAPVLDAFGDIAGGLTRGLVFRAVNTVNTNLWNVKTNADLALLMYDVTAFETAKVFNVNGLAGRLTYGGQTKHGVTLRLLPNEYLEVIVQDDLSSLLSFKMTAAGHLVTD